MHKMRASSSWLSVFLLSSSLACAQGVTFTTRISWANETPAGPHSSLAGVVVWLAPADNTRLEDQAVAKTNHLSLLQKGKTFQPHLLVVPVGSVVEFPNRDPFFHNVFSLFEGKRFDLGLYEAGSTREVHFNRPGVSYIFCNIHPEMSAVVIAIPTPYYATSDALGQIVIPNVSVGRYLLHLWHEGAQPDELEALTKEVTISERNSVLGVLRLKPPTLLQQHKNKYGREYDPPSPNSPGYEQP
jgi:plastocyanin